MAPADLLSLLLALLFPLLATWVQSRGLLPAWSSSIVLCYGIGIVVSNLHLWPVDQPLMQAVAGGGMLIGLPLLLFAVNLRESLVYARRMLFSFGLCCLSGLFCTAAAGLLFASRVSDGWKISGMLTGLYTGGTPNVQAIGIALEAPPEYLVLIQAADILLGGAYLLALVTFLPAVFARFYPVSHQPVGGNAGAMKVEDRVSIGQRLIQLAAGLAVTASGSLGCWVLTGNFMDPTVLILTVTTLSLAVTLTPLRARIGNSYPLGEYFVLIFCVALGLMADFRALAGEGLDLLYFSALALGGTTLLHLLLTKLFRVDRDTMMLSYVAAVYGPVFVVQVAAALNNRSLLAAGIAVSLLGFGIGNYLGIGLGYLLRFLTAA